MDLENFLARKDTMEGWFEPGAVQLFAWTDALQKREGITGDIFEIGVHHGKSAMLLGLMTVQGKERFRICDLFGGQDANVTLSGKGNKEIFLGNFDRFFDNRNFLDINEKLSADLSVKETGNRCRFFHVDGGHSADETFTDLGIASRAILAKGVVAIDDYFNEAWPGVSEGVNHYLVQHGDQLAPLAIGFNKMLLCRPDQHARYLELLESEGWRECVSVPRVEIKHTEFHGIATLVYFVPVGSQKVESPPALGSRIKGKVKRILGRE